MVSSILGSGQVLVWVVLLLAVGSCLCRNLHGVDDSRLGFVLPEPTNYFAARLAREYCLASDLVRYPGYTPIHVLLGAFFFRHERLGYPCTVCILDRQDAVLVDVVIRGDLASGKLCIATELVIHSLVAH